VERYVPFDLLHGLVDVTIQHGHRTELFQVAEGLLTVLRPPAPFRVYRPQRNVRLNNNRRAVLQVLDVLLYPFELFAAERS